jgi:hypothetical protein
MIDVLLPIFFITIFVVFILMIFTKKGKDIFVRITMGKILKDYGSMGGLKIMGATQGVRLLKCEKKGNTFFVIEASFPLGMQYTKLSPEMVKHLIDALKEEN